MPETTTYVYDAEGAILGRLASANAHVLGSVLTKFEARKAHFSYGYEYGYGYGRDSKAAA